MAEASASCKSKTQKGLTVSNDVVVAHQQLRDEDDHHHQKKKRKKEGENHRRRSNSKLERCDATCEKIHEIFGNDEVVRPKTKQKKYRSLGSIYMDTMPIVVVQGQPLKENLM